MDRDGLIIFLVIILAIVLVVGISWVVIIVIQEDNAQEHLRDEECQRLGYEKYYIAYGHKYCVKDGRKISIEGSCSSRRCVFIFK